MASVVSQSTASKSLSRSDPTKRTQGSDDNIMFLFFDQMTQQAILPDFLILLVYFWIGLQALDISFWDANPLDHIILFVDADTSLDIFCICVIAFAVITAASIIASVSFYKMRHRFPLWLLYLSRFCIEVVIPIFLCPIAWLFGLIVTKVTGDDADVASFIYLILVIMIAIFYYIILILSQAAFGNSAYMSSSIIYCLKPGIIFLVILELSALVFLEGIFVFLPLYCFQILDVCHILIAVALAVLTFNLPFFQYHTNAILAGIMTATVVGDIEWLFSVPFVIKASIILPLAIVFSIIYYFIFRFRIKKYRKRLHGYTSDSMTANEYLTEIQFDKYINIFLHIAFKEHNSLYLDNSMAKFSLEKNLKPDVAALLLRTHVVFPCKHTMLNALFNVLDSNIKLSYGHRFLLFQVYRIKLLRQSSSSLIANNQLDKLRENNYALRNQCYGFWQNDKPSYAFLGQIDRDIKIASSRWEQAIIDFPNSTNYREEYVRFLIDIKTDFHKACRQQYIKNLIESGKNFSIDHCFRSLIRVLPEYLKKNYVDVNGNLIVKKKLEGSANSSSKNASSVGSSLSDLDAKLEETIAKGVLKQARLRLTLQSALEGKNNSFLKQYMFGSLIISLFAIIIFIVLYSVFSTFFDSRKEIANINNRVNTLSSNISSMSFFQLLAWANQTGRFDETKALQDKHVLYDPLWSGENFYSYLGTSYLTTRRQFSNLSSMFFTYSINHDDSYSVGNILFEDITEQIVCVNHTQGKDPIKMNLKTYFLSVLHKFSLMWKEDIPPNDWWALNNEFCNGYVSIPALIQGFSSLRYSLMESESAEELKQRKNLMLIEIIVPLGFGVFSICILSIFMGLTIKETKYFVHLMTKISPDAKKEALETLNRQDIQTNETHDNIARSSNNNIYLIGNILMLILLLIIMIAMIVLILNESTELNSKHRYMSYWSLMSSIRESIMLQVALNSFIAVFITSPNKVDQHIFTYNEKANIVKGQLIYLRQVKNKLEKPDDGIKSILGFDTTIDDQLNKPICETPQVNSTIHDTYACGSINQQQSMFDDFITDIISKAENMNGTLHNQMIMNTFHILIAHLLPQLSKLDEMLDDLMDDFIHSYKNNLSIYLAIGLVCSVVFIFVAAILYKQLQDPYNAALTLLRRVSPIGIVNNIKLLDYLLNRHSEKNSSEMTTSRSIFVNASDAILLLSHTGTIENVNLAVTQILGYTPEQLLGQPFSVLFNEQDKEKVEQNIQFMISKQSSPQYEDKMGCISDTEQVVPCHVTIFDIGNGEDGGDSFVAAIRDETDLFEQQEEAEKAKKQSEGLLYQILPRDIVIRLNQGEKDISFEVPSASIMFIDIVKFSEFSANLTPSEIMGTLSLLFGQFDESLTKYPLITKIKLIGDVYMCAAGLFTPDIQPQAHADQLTRFGLEALSTVDETNIKMTANLSVRVGMNTGGPLIAGVLGTDKPVFDIIGDPINIASRLQSTDIPGRIQISQSVYDLIKDMEFNIDPRGEIFLKGKGKTNAFIVNPIDAFASHCSSIIMKG